MRALIAFFKTEAVYCDPLVELPAGLRFKACRAIPRSAR